MSAMDTSGLTSPADVASTEERWRDIRRFTEQSSEFASPHFEPGPENLECIKDCMVLVVGAGGLGCELLKNLALSGFTKIHVIDMDTIDLSNLNRQFLFRVGDIGKSKAEIAAKFIEKRVRGCSVTPHNCRIQDQPRSFYAQFSLVICGLDSIVARRWLNDTLCELVETDDDGNVISGVIPLIDGGTEGFKGNARVILPHMTACVECTLDLYPPQENFPLCTIATTPRLPEHCIEYVKVIEWEKFKPFQGTALDADSPEHVEWVYKRASKRADSYGIKGVDLRLTQADCIACGGKKISMSLKPDSKLLFLYDKLVEKYQLKNPTLKSSSCEAPLYMISDMIPQMKEPSEANLDKNIGELVLDGEEILVADEALTKTISLVVHFDLSEQGA